MASRVPFPNFNEDNGSNVCSVPNIKKCNLNLVFPNLYGRTEKSDSEQIAITIMGTSVLLLGVSIRTSSINT